MPVRCRRGFDSGVGVTEIYDFWRAVWHPAWSAWDGLWLFQVGQRPIDQALGVVVVSRPARRRIGFVAPRTAD